MHPSWEELARARRAAFEDGRLTLVVPVGKLMAFHETAEGQPATVVTLELHEPLGIRLAVREMKEGDFWDLWTEPEVTFDDPIFDDALLVRGDPYVVRMILGEEVRKGLLQLRGLVDHLSLSADRLIAMIVGRPIEADRLARLFDQVEDIGNLLRPPRERAGGPYRG